MNTEQLRKKALGIALRYHLSEFDPHAEPSDVLESIENDMTLTENIVVWEPFEDWETSSLVSSIECLADDIEATMAEALGLTTEADAQ